MKSVKHRFFCTQPELGILDETESAHALRVLRLKAGNEIEVIDGKGNLHSSVIRSEIAKKVVFEILHSQRESAMPFSLEIAIAPTKNIDRFDFFLEKVTEIGITKISPVICRNSERKELKTDKLILRLIASLKQSGNLYLPELADPMSLENFLSLRKSSDDLKFVAHCQPTEEKIPLSHCLERAKNIVILIGPEGDFTPLEIEAAKNAGFGSVSLGESRLRTETAGIVACLTAHLKNT